MATSLEAALDRYEAGLASGQRARAYEAALDAWRCSHAPEVARLVEKLAQTLCERAPLDVRKRSALEDMWIPIARSRRGWELRWLVEQLQQAAAVHAFDPKAVATLAACMAELGESTDDPSALGPAIKLARAGPFPSSWDATLRRWLRWMAGTGDRRLLPVLESLAEERRRERGLAAQVARKLAERLRAAPLASLEPPLAERVRELEAALEAPLPPEVSEAEPAATATAHDLFLQVLADPDDVAARAVWADALVRAGDERGELVALLVAAEAQPELAGKAARALKKGWRSLVGPIASSIRAEGVSFRGGLLAECVAVAKTQSAADLLFEHEQFQTVRRIHFEKHGRLTKVMRWLEEVTNVTEPALAELGAITLPRLRSIDLRLRAVPQGKKRSRALMAFAASRGVPSLTRLAMRFENETAAYMASESPRRFDDWVFEAPFAGQLEELDLPLHWYRLDRAELRGVLVRLLALPRLKTARLCPGRLESAASAASYAFSCDLCLDVSARATSVRYGLRGAYGASSPDELFVGLAAVAAEASADARLAWRGASRTEAFAASSLGPLS